MNETSCYEENVDFYRGLLHGEQFLSMIDILSQQYTQTITIMMVGWRLAHLDCQLCGQYSITMSEQVQHLQILVTAINQTLLNLSNQQQHTGFMLLNNTTIKQDNTQPMRTPLQSYPSQCSSETRVEISVNPEDLTR